AAFFLLLRAMLSQMDVPARQAYVMAMVPREERAAAASVTNVPRSLASALENDFPTCYGGRLPQDGAADEAHSGDGSGGADRLGADDGLAPALRRRGG